jgi:hypothetical protein
MTVPLRFEGGQPQPMGVEAVAVKMGLIVAQEDKGAERLTEGEQRAVTVASKYLGTEYSRVADSNERLMRELAKKLTADEVRIVSAVASFFADEYDRISTDNERLTRDVGELRSQVQALETRLMEIARMAQTEVGE